MSKAGGVSPTEARPGMSQRCDDADIYGSWRASGERNLKRFDLKRLQGLCLLKNFEG